MGDFNLLNKWRFPKGEWGEIKGINDAGVETFNSNSLRALVRESLQNSLDASKGGRVTVDFEEFTVPFDAIPDSSGLYKALELCRQKGGDQSEAATRFFDNALATANDECVRIMRVSDYGTTGLRGARTCEQGTDWSRLIKESGSSGKSGTSGGSFGIGKYSAFACSSMRTVFFSSLDDEGVESHIGVSRLISYREEEGQPYTTGVGYYSGSEMNVAILEQLRMRGVLQRDDRQTGTDIYIIGFKCEGDITRKIIQYVLIDFLVSIWRGKLTVNVNGQEEVCARNLGRHIGNLNEYDEDPLVKETIEHYDLLTSKDESIKIIEFDPQDLRGVRKYRDLGWRKGDCFLFLKQGNDALNREVMITRAAGMRLFNQKNISGSINFTGILMIEGEKMNADFSDMEAPSHDSWSAERAIDPSLGAKMIKALRDWVRDAVKDAFAIAIEDEVEAYGTSLYLPQRDSADEGSTTAKEELLNSQIAEVQQKSITPKKEDRGLTISTGVTPDPEGSAYVKGNGHAKGKVPRLGVLDGDSPGFTRVQIRQRLVCTNRAKGEYRLAFTVPHDASKVRIALCIQGEQGEDIVTVKSARSNVGAPQGVSCDGNRITLQDVTAGDLAEVTFTTDFPHYCMMGADYYETK